MTEKNKIIHIQPLVSSWKQELLFLLMIGCALLTMVLMTWSMDTADPYNAAPATPIKAASMPAVQDPSYEGIIRFHVKANSDSEEDQSLKLQVRNHVLAKVQNHLMDAFAREMNDTEHLMQSGSLEMTEARRLELTRNWLQEHLNQIETWAEETIRAEGFDYPVTASLGVTWIPEREYDGIYFPPGNYEALTLNIGSAQGQNWWCVLFPPLCLIDCGEELGEARFEAELASISGGRIILKSRILELLKKQKSGS